MSNIQTLATIIVSYNTSDLTCNAISAVLAEYRLSKISGEIIVVDNNSSDYTVKNLKKLYHDHIKIIENKNNLGFAAANNQGIRYSTCSHILLLNSDTVIHPGALKNMLGVFIKYPDQNTANQENTQLIDRLGIVSCTLENLDGSIQKQGGALPDLWTIFLWWILPLPNNISIFPNHWNYHIEDVNFFNNEQKIGWVGGTAMLLRKDLIDEIGLLDEGIFMYSEDVEYCLRAKNHHWDIVYTPSARITHFGSASSSSENALSGEILGLNYLAKKHFSAWEYIITRKLLRLGSLLRLLLFGIIKNDVKKKNLYQKIFKQLSPSN